MLKNTVAAVAKQQRGFSKSSPSLALELIDNRASLPLFDFFAHPKPTRSYILGHGASGFSKKRFNHTPVTTTPLSVSAQVGEDAYFRRSDAIGVADGIGGWSSTAGNRFAEMNFNGG